jgi:hypothetical protein
MSVSCSEPPRRSWGGRRPGAGRKRKHPRLALRGLRIGRLSAQQLMRTAIAAEVLAASLPPEHADVADLIADAAELAAEAARAL